MEISNSQHDRNVRKSKKETFYFNMIMFQQFWTLSYAVHCSLVLKTVGNAFADVLCVLISNIRIQLALHDWYESS